MSTRGSSGRSCSYGSEKSSTEDSGRLPGRPSPNPKTSSFSSLCWDLSEKVLCALNSAAQYAPTPYLGSLSVVALSIFNSVQGAKENQIVLGQLVQTISEFLYAISDAYKELHPAGPTDFSGTGKSQPQASFSSDPTLNAQVEELFKTLTNINEWITGVRSRTSIRRIIASRSDLAVIQDFRDQLNAAKDKFQMQSFIALRKSVSEIALQQDKMISQQHKMDQDAASRHKTVRDQLMNMHNDFQNTILGGPITDSPTSTLLAPVSRRSNTSPSSTVIRPRPNTAAAPSRSNTVTNLYPGPESGTFDPFNPFDLSKTENPNPFSALAAQPNVLRGNVSVQNVSGNYTVNKNIDQSTRQNFRNVYNYDGQNMAFGGGGGGMRMGRGDMFREPSINWYGPGGGFDAFDARGRIARPIRSR
ncbi:hypothetical protein EV361DRAFT_951385 [Lentinula raphanica]|nr:hypothetical protein EV360DRAFT_85252 [Lentinula raphanica]KAJ3822281.1 hypothetical protein F5880DRAFT_702707 [Lentinula raphanica]KAJ3969543.1 hypothetical protein EV361DRAFT_951385 [Lentinula raphanica]